MQLASRWSIERADGRGRGYMFGRLDVFISTGCARSERFPCTRAGAVGQSGDNTRGVCDRGRGASREPPSPFSRCIEAGKNISWGKMGSAGRSLSARPREWHSHASICLIGLLFLCAAGVKQGICLLPVAFSWFRRDRAASGALRSANRWSLCGHSPR